MPGAPGPDGRHDDLGADELEGLALLVPDDARSLDVDRRAYLGELAGRNGDPPRRDRRRTDVPDVGPGGHKGTPGPPARWRQLAFGGAGGVGLAGPVLLVLLVVVGLVGSTFSVFVASPSSDRAMTALAAASTGPAGQVGGLLPDLPVTVAGSSYSLRDFRPAMLVLVPATCQACGDVLRSLHSQAQEYDLVFALVGAPAQVGQLRALNEAELGGGATIAVDSNDVIHSSYQPSGVTALLVRSNGIVAKVARDVTATTRLETALTQLDPRPPATA
jgi:hypothetical protein